MTGDPVAGWRSGCGADHRGRHARGLDGALFAASWIGGGYQAGPDGVGVTVAWAPDGTFRRVERTVRPDADVVGWVPACGCGWRGPPVTQAADLSALGADRWNASRLRSAYSEDAFLPEELEDELIWREWQDHVEPVDLVAKVAEAHRDHVRAGRVLDEAVAAARAAGASWGDVGRTTGMTR